MGDPYFQGQIAILVQHQFEIYEDFISLQPFSWKMKWSFSPNFPRIQALYSKPQQREWPLVLSFLVRWIEIPFHLAMLSVVTSKSRSALHSTKFSSFASHSNLEFKLTTLESRNIQSYLLLIYNFNIIKWPFQFNVVNFWCLF